MQPNLRKVVLFVVVVLLPALIDFSAAEEDSYGPAQFALMAHHHIKKAGGALNKTMMDAMDKAAESIAKAEDKMKGKVGKENKNQKTHQQSQASRTHETVQTKLPSVENKKAQDVHGQGCISGSASNPSDFDWSKYAGMGGQSGNSGSSSGGAGGFDWSKYVPGAGGNSQGGKQSEGERKKEGSRSKEQLHKAPQSYEHTFDDNDNMPAEEVASSAESLATIAEDLASKLLLAAGNLREAANRLKQQNEVQDRSEDLQDPALANDQVVNVASIHNVENAVAPVSTSSSILTTFLITVMVFGGVGLSMYLIDQKRKSSYQPV